MAFYWNKILKYFPKIILIKILQHNIFVEGKMAKKLF